MTQTVHILVGDRLETFDLPEADEEVLPGVRWGDTSLLLTPAWIARHAHIRWRRRSFNGVFRQKSVTLAEDVVFCLLGGFGIRAEVADAAYRHLSLNGLFEAPIDRDVIEKHLREPLGVGGRSVRYRFPAARARYIAEALDRLRTIAPPLEELRLRDYLVSIPGIGPKTASYVVRNHLGSDRVAILDIHLLRAGRTACLFPEGMTLPRHYLDIEQRFLAFAKACGVPASVLDLIVWEMLRTIPAERREAAARLNRRHLPSDRGPTIRVGPYLSEQIST